MEWQFIVAIVLVIPLVLFPVALIWYLNIGGTYALVKERKFSLLRRLVRVVRLTFLVTVPVAIYGFALWFALGHYGWQVVLAIALVLPIILFIPVVVWAITVSGLYTVATTILRRRFAPVRSKSAAAEVLTTQ